MVKFNNKSEMLKNVFDTRLQAIQYGASTIYENINTIDDYGFWSDEGQEAVEAILSYTVKQGFKDIEEAIRGNNPYPEAQYPLTKTEREIAEILIEKNIKETRQELEGMEEMQEILEQARSLMKDAPEIQPAPLD